MLNLETTYLGIKLKNPLVAASSGSTGSLEKIRELEKYGIAAVVLKSIFEEQIRGEAGELLFQCGHHASYPEATDYIQNYLRHNSVGKHTELVTQVKQNTAIPVIASINCVSFSAWTSFAHELEDAGADAIELNVFYLPTNRNQTSEEVEKVYIDILQGVKSKVKIPVSVKIGSNFTSIIGMAEKLKANGAKGLVMFNRFYEPDIDLEKMDLKASEIWSSPAEFSHSLRWIGLVSSQVSKIDLAATTGIHNGETVIKFILAGAQIAQLCSTLYLNGATVIPQILDELKQFMKKWNYKSLEEFRGKLSANKVADPMQYERYQFMKYYSNHK